MWYLTNRECKKIKQTFLGKSKVKINQTCKATEYYEFLVKIMITHIGYDGETAYDCMVNFLFESLNKKNKSVINAELDKPEIVKAITDEELLKDITITPGATLENPVPEEATPANGDASGETSSGDDDGGGDAGDETSSGSDDGGGETGVVDDGGSDDGGDETGVVDDGGGETGMKCMVVVMMMVVLV